MKFKVYRHRRNDTNEVFYIGIGKNSRHSSKRYRNKYWHNIVNKCGYSIEILQENLSREEACELEIFLIKLYGRKNLGLGNLVNMTDGGEGVTNISEEARKKKAELLKSRNLDFKGNKNPFYGKKHSEETLKLLKSRVGENNPRFGVKMSKESKEILSQNRKGKYTGFEHNKSKIILDTNTGIFYGSLSEAASALNLNRSTLKSWLQRGTKNKTSLIYC